jgi:hypothetical protein
MKPMFAVLAALAALSFASGAFADDHGHNKHGAYAPVCRNHHGRVVRCPAPPQPICRARHGRHGKCGSPVAAGIGHEKGSTIVHAVQH